MAATKQTNNEPCETKRTSGQTNKQNNNYVNKPRNKQQNKTTAPDARAALPLACLTARTARMHVRVLRVQTWAHRRWLLAHARERGVAIDVAAEVRIGIPQPNAVFVCLCVCVSCGLRCLLRARCVLYAACGLTQSCPAATGSSDRRALDRQLTAPPASTDLTPRVPTASPRPMRAAAARAVRARRRALPQELLRVDPPSGTRVRSRRIASCQSNRAPSHGGTERTAVASSRRMVSVGCDVPCCDVPCGTYRVRCTMVSALPAGALSVNRTAYIVHGARRTMRPTARKRQPQLRNAFVRGSGLRVRCQPTLS